VLGVDVSAEAVDAAREQAEAAGFGGAVSFRVHDLTGPMPDDCGRFDFVVCRGVLGRTVDPHRVLTSLARALTPDGLLLVTLPSRAERLVARALRQAVESLAAAEAPFDERIGLAWDVYRSLRPDHPVRAHIDRLPQASSPAGVDRLLAGYLNDGHDWTLDDATEMLARAGLAFLYAATPWRWQPDRVFACDALSDRLQDGIDRLAPDRLSRLIEALDPTLLDDEFQLYACPAGYTPPAPTWPATRLDDPATFARLVPETTGLARVEASTSPGGRVAYRTVSGLPGELDRMSALLFAAVDGSTSCGEIEKALASRTRAGDGLPLRQSRWIHMADAGLILLKPPATP
jgi:SAM-dependent methyltransferase